MFACSIKSTYSFWLNAPSGHYSYNTITKHSLTEAYRLISNELHHLQRIFRCSRIWSEPKANIHQICTKHDRRYYNYACGRACLPTAGHREPSNCSLRTLVLARLRAVIAYERPAVPGVSLLTSMDRDASTLRWKAVPEAVMKRSYSIRIIKNPSNLCTIWTWVEVRIYYF